LNPVTGSTSLEKKLAAGVAFASEDTWWIAVAGINGADTMVTTDGGDTWWAHSDGPSGSVLEVQAFDNQTAWITTTEGLFATFGGGRTWKRLQSELSTNSRP